MRSILLIRHGATALNSKDPTVDRIRGWSDWPLSDIGRGEAKKLAEKIAVHHPAVLLSSDLFRAEQTAFIIAELTDVKREPASIAFRPWDVGSYVGRPAADVVPRLAHFATKTPDIEVPGGESFLSFRYRFLDGLHAALWKHDELIGIVTHHRNERLLKAWAKAGYGPGIDPDEFAMKGETTGHCEIIDIPVDRLTATVREGMARLHLARRHVDENART